MFEYMNSTISTRNVQWFRIDKHANKHWQVTFEPENIDIWMVKDSAYNIYSYYLNSLLSIVIYLFRHVMSNYSEMDMSNM